MNKIWIFKGSKFSGLAFYTVDKILFSVKQIKVEQQFATEQKVLVFHFYCCIYLSLIMSRFLYLTFRNCYCYLTFRNCYSVQLFDPLPHWQIAANLRKAADWMLLKCWSNCAWSWLYPPQTNHKLFFQCSQLFSLRIKRSFCQPCIRPSSIVD